MKWLLVENFGNLAHILDLNNVIQNFMEEERKINILIRNALIILSILIIGCEDNRYEYDDIDLVYNINLPT